ncbi:MAG TPA: proton-conducting transporter membrane subunit, partial [Myxococcota bacterium]|nr:proton-conducting transporter membrane subunit [Myxococcota bacterium]
MSLPLATSLWLVPALFGAVVRRVDAASWRNGLVVTSGVINVALAAWAAWAFDGPALVEDVALGPLRYHVAVDGLNLLFLPLVTILGLLMAVYGVEKGRHAGPGWHANVLWFQACLLGMLLSVDLGTYAAFMLAEIAPIRALIARWGTGANRRAVARQASRSLGLGAALWLVGVGLLGELHREATGAWSTDVAALAGLDLSLTMQTPLFFLLFYAVALRSGMFPMHGWYPPAVAEGPVAGLNVMLLGVKVGLATLVRLVLPVLPGAWASQSAVPTVLGVLGVVYGTVMALNERELRRMMAWVAISHTGFVVMGAFTGGPLGVAGAVLEALNLGVAAAGLYFAAGFLWLRTGSTVIADVRPVASAMPRFGFVFLLTALAGIGMPGTLGFDALHLEVEGALAVHRYAVALAEAAATVLFAGTLFTWYYRLFLAREGDRGAVDDLHPRELGIALVLVALVLGGGLYPTPWVNAVE